MSDQTRAAPTRHLTASGDTRASRTRRMQDAMRGVKALLSRASEGAQLRSFAGQDHDPQPFSTQHKRRAPRVEEWASGEMQHVSVQAASPEEGGGGAWGLTDSNPDDGHEEGDLE